ncbi:glycosyltransferase [Streptacidiphilus rugosus]|uniref:glycosyltransferase n=1 Tax=Streptacidiphilus rugosus TaxID=405783 RepID=UPI000A7E7873|nr:glycosyltransferase [Streptacidiphilus rugosus]
MPELQPTLQPLWLPGTVDADERSTEVLSVYEGLFCDGTRKLHTDVVVGLHGSSQQHRVLSIHQEVRRQNTVQRMRDDTCYRLLTEASIPVGSLGRGAGQTVAADAFTDRELSATARHVGRADVVLSLDEQPLALLNAASLAGTPVIVCLHRTDPHSDAGALAHLQEAISSGRLAAGICCAEATKAAYMEAGIPGSLLHVIPNGVRPQLFRPDPERRAVVRRELGIPPEAPLIVLAARYDPVKNVPLFLRAARLHLGHAPEAHAVMCGAGMGPANADLHDEMATAFADRPDLLRRLHPIGLRTDMHHVYAACDVVALTSTSEAAPLALIEGMMCGAVPVTTDVGDSASIVEGYGLVTPSEPQAIDAAWAEAVSLRARAAGVAPPHIRDRFSQSRMLSSYRALIDRVVHESPVLRPRTGMQPDAVPGRGLPVRTS